MSSDQSGAELTRDQFDRLTDVVERLASSASVRAVYGDPVETDDRTVVPVARVAYGFGGGYGEGTGEDDEGGRGGGGGGGAAAKPVGAIDISEGGTEFVRFGGGSRLALAAVGLALGLAAGLLAGEVLRRGD